MQKKNEEITYAHGVNVQADMEAIEEMSAKSSDRATKWSEAFIPAALRHESNWLLDEINPIDSTYKWDAFRELGNMTVATIGAAAWGKSTLLHGIIPSTFFWQKNKLSWSSCWC